VHLIQTRGIVEEEKQKLRRGGPRTSGESGTGQKVVRKRKVKEMVDEIIE